MIVVVGSVSYRPAVPGQADAAEGRAAAIARAAVSAGAGVQLVARIGDDPPGDALLLALARDGIGHAAILRDAGMRTSVTAPRAAIDEDVQVGEEIDGAGTPAASGPSTAPAVLRPGDLELGLRYLTDFRVLVSADPLDAGASDVAANAAAFAGAQLVAVIIAGGAVAAAFDGATVLEAPASDPDGDFARFVGAYAAALDRGEAAADAFGRTAAAAGWEHAEA